MFRYTVDFEKIVLYCFTVADKRCPPVPAVINARPNHDVTNRGTTVFITCVDGYLYADGSETINITCDDSDAWTPGETLGSCAGELQHLGGGGQRWCRLYRRGLSTGGDTPSFLPRWNNLSVILGKPECYFGVIQTFSLRIGP